MELKLYDTLTRKVQAFKPLDRKNVRMYVCGPTVYDFAHIGNARPVIVFDVLFRLLRHRYGESHVKYVRNITDVDDKINARAAEEYPNFPLNEAIRLITEKTEWQFHADVDALGCLRPTFEPRATEHITEMKELIERLLKTKRAYVFEDHVLFRIKGLRSYGKLSHRTLQDMQTSSRGEVAPKRNPMDFVLWKPSRAGEPGWPSLGGIATVGRPGWHIECSAMSWKYLGERFDLHGGGVDLLFPHHENERAQSCCAFGRFKLAQVWMHNGFLQVEGEKMSKSQGNFVTIRQLLDNWNGTGWPGEALRFNMLRKHYRQPIDWTESSLDESHKVLWDWYGDLEGLQPGSSVSKDALLYLYDDLNTPKLIAELHGLRRKKNFQALRDTLGLLGFSGKRESISRKASAVGTASGARSASGEGATVDVPPAAVELRAHPPQIITTSLSKAEIEEQIEQRKAARQAKNFAESDRIRDELAKMGVVLKDNKDGTTTWEFAR